MDSLGRFSTNLFVTILVFTFALVASAKSPKSAAPDSCRSRTERPLYHTRYTEQPSQAFLDRTAAYEKMHKHCMQPHIRTNNFHGNFTNATADASRCKYVFFTGVGGLGNRIHGLVSTFLYALLTNRTLIAGSQSDAELFCNPFMGSSWVVSKIEGDFMMRDIGKLVTVASLLKQVPLRNKANLFLKYNSNREHLSFFCDDSQLVLREIQWLVLYHGRYFGTLFTGMIFFRQEMERLFPTRAVYTHLVRYLLNPIDLYWDRITQTFNTHLRNADRRVGLQVRTFQAHDSWANERVLECAVNVSRYLPAPTLVTEQKNLTAPSGLTKSIPTSANGSVPEKIIVFVASLHASHLGYLKKTYENGLAADSSSITFYEEKTMEKEHWGIQSHAMALVDIWLLSFCDEIQTSMTSTFGELSAALAGVRPYVMNIANRTGFDWEINKIPVCVPAFSIDPCSLAPLKRPCAPPERYPLKGQPEYVKVCDGVQKDSWQLSVGMGRKP